MGGSYRPNYFACKSKCEGITKVLGFLDLHFDFKYLVPNNFVCSTNHCVGCFDNEDVNLFWVYCIGLAHEMVNSPMASSEIGVKGILNLGTWNA